MLRARELREAGDALARVERDQADVERVIAAVVLADEQLASAGDRDVVDVAERWVLETVGVVDDVHPLAADVVRQYPAVAGGRDVDDPAVEPDPSPRLNSVAPFT